MNSDDLKYQPANIKQIMDYIRHTMNESLRGYITSTPSDWDDTIHKEKEIVMQDPAGKLIYE